MNRLEKLKQKLAHDFMNSIFRNEPYKDPPDFDVPFCAGFDASSAEYEKIIAELEGALEYYSIECTWNENRDVAKEALQKLKEFRGVG